MFCTNCGKEISDQAVVCINCGVATKNAAVQTDDKPILGFILSFLFPIVGLIISIFEYKKTKEYGGDGSLAKAGIIISSIFLGFPLIGVIIAIFVSAAVASSLAFLPLI